MKILHIHNHDKNQAPPSCPLLYVQQSQIFFPKVIILQALVCFNVSKEKNDD